MVKNTDPGLIKVEVDDVKYVGIPRRLAGQVGACIRAHVAATAKAAGTDPTDVPLWALALQLALVQKADAGAERGTNVGGGGDAAPLSVHDVADHLGVDTRTVRRAAAEGRLVGRKVGDIWTFRRADLDQYNPRKAAGE